MAEYACSVRLSPAVKAQAKFNISEFAEKRARQSLVAKGCHSDTCRKVRDELVHIPRHWVEPTKDGEEGFWDEAHDEWQMDFVGETG